MSIVIFFWQCRFIKFIQILVHEFRIKKIKMYCSFFGHIELYSIYHQLTCWLNSNFQCYPCRSRETRSPHDATPHGSNPTPAEWTRVSRIQAFICWHLVVGKLLLVNAVLSLSVIIMLRLIDNELISCSHLM